MDTGVQDSPSETHITAVRLVHDDYGEYMKTRSWPSIVNGHRHPSPSPLSTETEKTNHKPKTIHDRE